MVAASGDPESALAEWLCTGCPFGVERQLTSMMCSHLPLTCDKRAIWFIRAGPRYLTPWPKQRPDLSLKPPSYPSTE
eukprot:185333-Amphidinium_carterae.1